MKRDFLLSKRAFTAVEMIAVVAILIIIMTMSVSALRSNLQRGRVNEAVDAVLATHQQALQAARMYSMTESSPSGYIFNLVINGFNTPNTIELLHRNPTSNTLFYTFSAPVSMNPNVVVFITDSTNPNIATPAETFSLTNKYRQNAIQYTDKTGALTNTTVSAPANLAAYASAPTTLYVIARPIDWVSGELSRQARAMILVTGVTRSLPSK